MGTLKLLRQNFYFVLLLLQLQLVCGVILLVQHGVMEEGGARVSMAGIVGGRPGASADKHGHQDPGSR